MVLQREEHQPPLPIRIKHELLAVTASDNILKAESGLNARSPLSTR